MASNSLLTSKYFNRLYVDRLKAEKSQIVDEYSTLLTPELLDYINNVMSTYDPKYYIPFDSVSDSITLPLEFIKTGWITPSKGNPTVSDLLIYTEDGHSLLLENSNGSWDSEYYSTARLQVVSLHNTSNGFNFLEVGNKECIKKLFNNNLHLIGSTISILDMEEWTSVTLYTKSTNTFYYYTIAINVTHTGSNEQLKDDVKTLDGDTVELDDKINVIFKSNTVHPFVLPLTESPVAIQDNLDLDIFTKSPHVYANSGEKTMIASKLLAWASGSEPQAWNNAHNYTGNTNRWPSQLINQTWWCGVGIGSYTETVLTMSLGYYYIKDGKNMTKYVGAPGGKYTGYEYDVVTTVKGEILIASDGTVTVKDVPNILSVISSAPIDAETTFVFAEVFDISTAVPTAKTCYCGIIVNGQDIPCSCQCIYVKTISQPLIDFINTAVKSPDSITFKTSYP